MKSSQFEELILRGDQYLKKREFGDAIEYYELALSLLVSEHIKDKRSKAIGSFAGWTAGFLTGGLGLEDLIIIPSVSKGIAKVMGVDDRRMNIAIQSVCLREVNCFLQSRNVRDVIQRDIVLKRFVLLISSSRAQNSNLEKLLNLFMPEMAKNNPFDSPEMDQSLEIILLDEINTNAPLSRENLYLLYSYLNKIGDTSQLFRTLTKLFGGQDQPGMSDDFTHGSAPDSNSMSSSNSANLYEILGVNEGATEQEIRAAFKDLIKKYHPDKFASLSKEFQDLANHKAQQIIHAYDELLSQINRL